MTRPTVAAISGSLRASSYTRASLVHALDAAERAGGSPELIDLREYELPPINPDERQPVDAERLTTTVREAEAVLLGTPVYHGSFSAPLKNALDYCGAEKSEIFRIPK